ncbi:MAG: hypothetical protein WCE79_01645 [Xanthobacteraceae bacterium]
MSAKPSPNPHAQDIYAAVGRALSTWSNVEEIIGSIFTHASVPVGTTSSVGQIMSAYWAVESFRGKLNVTDAAIRFRFALVPECLSDWQLLHKRAREKNTNRNELAHGSVMNFGSPEQTYFIPSFYKSFLADTHEQLAEFQANPSRFDLRPKHRLTAKEIDDRTQGFKEFYKRLEGFGWKLTQDYLKRAPH